jgi:hypothetical protein
MATTTTTTTTTDTPAHADTTVETYSPYFARHYPTLDSLLNAGKPYARSNFMYAEYHLAYLGYLVLCEQRAQLLLTSSSSAAATQQQQQQQQPETLVFCLDSMRSAKKVRNALYWFLAKNKHDPSNPRPLYPEDAVTVWKNDLVQFVDGVQIRFVTFSRSERQLRGIDFSPKTNVILHHHVDDDDNNITQQHSSMWPFTSELFYTVIIPLIEQGGLEEESRHRGRALAVVHDMNPYRKWRKEHPKDPTERFPMTTKDTIQVTSCVEWVKSLMQKHAAVSPQ